MNDLVSVVLIGSAVIVMLVAAYAFTVITSGRRIVESQRRLLDEVRERERHYRSLFDNSVAGIVTFRRSDLRLLDINDSLAEKLELTDKQHASALFDEIMADVRPDILSQIERSGKFRMMEISYDTPGGTTLLFQTSGQYDPKEKVIHGVMIDITEQKKLEEAVIRSQKVEALSILTGSIAHDLQNIFVPVQMALQLLQKHVRTSSAKTALRSGKASVKEGIALVGNILSFVKGTQKELSPLRLNPVIRSAVHSLLIDRQIELEVENTVKREDVRILGDEYQLKYMLVNILRNAIEAINGRGTVTLTVSRVPGRNGKPEGGRNGLVKISVADTGSGIPTDLRGRIFEPFYTTKRRHGGSGIGLSMVAEIVKRHNGTIAVADNVPVGTVVSIHLPRWVQE